ncbi:P-loop containing nucleoside triphosphate hydrolase protein [Pholiota conissans]|uniref:P-loop containing nucleoside triphosphate hydrolase protein n=1 Tax=Pholiota conissans TaxID=109636 RepID=A0A9P5YLN2_9AGAR|nr:P-loop containing nucleoside triphosphate hydrolase protein [Pholiota conissans]
MASVSTLKRFRKEISKTGDVDFTIAAACESKVARKKPYKEDAQKGSRSSTATCVAHSETFLEENWPNHLQSAINTVVAFISSKRQLAVSFSAVRSSVEGLLKHPLEIGKISEIKALIPDLIQFSYIPSADLHSNGRYCTSYNSVDYRQTTLQPSEKEGYVLVLDFTDNPSAKKSSQSLSLKPVLSPSALKKLIQSRNDRFRRAVQELLNATPVSENPMDVLINAGRVYIPVNPSIPVVDLVEGGKTVPNLGERSSADNVISELVTSNWYKDQIVYRRSIEAKGAQIAFLDFPISKTITEAVLASRNIKSLYSHQVSAIDAIQKGRHVVVSTSTASGKSVIYQIPILTYLEESASATAILVFPTKALAQDQKASLEQLFRMCPSLNKLKFLQNMSLDIRDTASIILTNFDTIHASILPNEETWRRSVCLHLLHHSSSLLDSFLKRLKRPIYSCLNLLDRSILFVSCSATLSNPAEYMSKVFALDASEVQVISNDGAPSGAKDYLIWNPPLVDEMHPTLGRCSSLSEASNVMRFLMKKGFRVILFCKIRKVCELAIKTIKSDLSNEGRLDILDRDRRKIEHDAFSGQLLGIIATNALELGIDIGALDAVIMLGFPMTVSNFKQQAGRAGRRSRDSLAIMVTEPFPIDQHFVQFPSELFDNSLDDLVLDVDNGHILEAHLQCAAHEIPLALDDARWFGPMTSEICKNKLKRDKDGWYHTHPKFLPSPSRHVSIRCAQEDTYAVVEIKKKGIKGTVYMLEEVEVSRALFELYEGGVVKEIRHDEKIAQVVREDVNYITSPRREFFQSKGNVILDAVELITPPWEREALGFWIDLPDNILKLLQMQDIDSAAAIHAAEHAFLNQFVLSQDMKTDCRVVKDENKDDSSSIKRLPRLIFYDAAGKIGGIAARAFDHVEAILSQAQSVVNNCHCPEGCKSCVQSVMCKDSNLISSKLGASIILNVLLGQCSTDGDSPKHV